MWCGSEVKGIGWGGATHRAPPRWMADSFTGQRVARTKICRNPSSELGIEKGTGRRGYSWFVGATVSKASPVGVAR